MCPGCDRSWILAGRLGLSPSGALSPSPFIYQVSARDFLTLPCFSLATPHVALTPFPGVWVSASTPVSDPLAFGDSTSWSSWTCPFSPDSALCFCSHALAQQGPMPPVTGPWETLPLAAPLLSGGLATRHPSKGPLGVHDSIPRCTPVFCLCSLEPLTASSSPSGMLAITPSPKRSGHLGPASAFPVSPDWSGFHRCT